MGQEDRAGKGKAGKGKKQAGKAASKPEKTNITLQEAAGIASGTMVGAIAGPAAGAMAKAATTATAKAVKGKPAKAGKEQTEEKKKIEETAKTIRKAMGAIPIVNIAAATPAFEGGLETMLRSMDEGLKTGAKASSEEEEYGFWTKLMVVMMESKERDLKIQGEMAVGFGKEMGDKGKNAWKFGGELWSFLKGENPELPGEVWDAMVATGEGVVYSVTHPKETMQALEEALSTATPEDMGRLLADFYVGQVTGVGAAGAVGKVKRVVNALETVSPNPSTVRAVARVADEAAEELKISARNTSRGNPNAINHFGADLNTRQQNLLDQLPDYDSSVIVKKSDVNLNDLSALTAETGNEFAMFTRGSQRLIVRGNSNSVNINADLAQELYNAGYKWSGHTHPGNGLNVKIASEGDRFILEKFNQSRSSIYDSSGRFDIFEGD